VRDKWFVNREGPPSDAMRKLLQYGMHIGVTAGGGDKVLWSEDNIVQMSSLNLGRISRIHPLDHRGCRRRSQGGYMRRHA
jgi:hypothetical protein